MFPDNLYELFVGVVVTPFMCVAIGYFIYIAGNIWRLSYY